MLETISMKTNKLWVSGLLCLLFTVLWLILMILSVSMTGPVNSFEQAVSSVVDTGILFQLSYINAVFVTITTTIFFVFLYNYCNSLDKDWSLIGFIFIPVYCILNLIVYFSQITVIPRLIALMNEPKYSEAYQVILGQFIQGWSGSAVSVFNQLAYAILGIPSIIFGVLLIKSNRLSTLGGRLLTLNGISCIIGVIGTVANNRVLAIGSVVGGALFLFALIALVWSCANGTDKSISKGDKEIRPHRDK